ncbi:trehalose/maltose import ATP-binding protein MalK [Halalkalicoccus paucihalophilus]|uniref:Trehalose/maltose import ATP-binding protein MalK n=1 Tax=Halalkalicoccus paucihalophilus TaxID=1008153 RepID=A0A151AAY9_9EURY|nr:ATP-binding cassette domain-containing protein [Halalkalicoccus paucihalophilus]KYH24764.1 trehalose/maltose import ATP-binding protein MalK [Halalkalicoccus paucihalophilus]
MPPTLETRNLTRVVEDDRLVDGISVAIREREVIVIVGPSGAGKSSFLRLLNRLDEPTAGTVLLDGVDYHEIPPRELRVRVGLVPQSPALVPGTVFENATRGLTLRNEPIDAERTTQMLTQLGLDGYEDRTVEELSGGETQRVAIARTLLNGPEVLLLDEPTASLDSASEARVEDLLSELGLTTVLVTHDEEQARRIGDRVMELRNGQLVRLGSPTEVLS